MYKLVGLSLLMALWGCALSTEVKPPDRVRQLVVVGSVTDDRGRAVVGAQVAGSAVDPTIINFDTLRVGTCFGVRELDPPEILQTDVTGRFATVLKEVIHVEACVTVTVTPPLGSPFGSAVQSRSGLSYRFLAEGLDTVSFAIILR